MASPLSAPRRIVLDHLLSLEGVEIYPRDHRTVITFPTNDDKVLAAIQWPREEFDAIHGAELLAEAIDSGLAGRRPLQEALADYEQRRNEMVLPLYELNCQMATLEPPPPDMQPLFSALRGNLVEVGRYMATIGGTVSPAEFFGLKTWHGL